MQAEEITIPLPNIKLAGLCWEQSQQPVIIALHGWLDNAASFSHLAPFLQGYCVIALDMAGHGYSQHLPSGETYKLAEVANYVLQVLAYFQLEKTIFIGHSLGGVIASYIAAHFPTKVEQLIMLDAIGPLSHEALNAPGRLQQSVQRFVAAEQRKPKNYPSIATMLKLRAKVNGVTEEQLLPLVERAVVETKNGYCWRFDPKLRLPSMSYFSEVEVLAMLSRIKAPTLVVEAEQGILTNMDFVKARQAVFSNITITALPRTHHLHLAHPKQVAEVILGFLKKFSSD